MTVSELIKALKLMPQDAGVFLYNAQTEDDCPVHSVIEETEQYYCQGDSYVEEYLDNNPDKTVVILSNLYGNGV